MSIATPQLPEIQRPPNLDPRKIPTGEQAAFKHISELLDALALYEEHFRVAQMLFEACESERRKQMRKVLQDALNAGDLRSAKLDSVLVVEPTLGGWQEMAARDGAISIYHFGCIVEAINTSLSESPTFNEAIDHRLFRLARRSFHGAFPHYEQIRHVVGHAAEFTKSLAERKNHSCKGPFRASVGTVGMEIKGQNRVTQLTGNLIGNSYFVTYEGEVRGYEISAGTADRLTTIKMRVYSSIGNGMLVR